MRGTRSSLLAFATAFAAVELAVAAPAAANGCYAATYATCSNSKITGATSCIDGYYVAGGRCRPLTDGQYLGADGKPASCAAANVKTCTATTILTCKSGFFLTTDKSACVSSCPDSFFGNTATGSCTACYSTAIKTCKNARLTGALTCMSGYGLTGGRCMPTTRIPEGAYLSSDGHVRSCAVHQKTCNEMGALSCESPYFLTPDADCSLTCPQSMFGNSNGACQSCYSRAIATCSNARATGALSCSTGYYLTGGRCMPESAIPAGKYGKDGQIYSCPDGQASCTATGPKTCETGYTLSADNTKCEATCPAHSVCENGGSTATSCTDSYLLYNGRCVQSCPAGVFYYAEKAACFDECPARSWHYDMSTCYGTCPQHWIDNQYTCTECGLNAESCDQNHAITCTSDQYIIYQGSDGQYNNCAYIGCGEGQYTPDFNTECTACPGGSNVALCYPITGRTIRCKDGYELTFGEWDTVGTCVAANSCPAHSVCAEDGTVTSCTDSYLLYNGQCVESCPAGAFLFAERSACFDQCPSDSWFYDTNRCDTPTTCPQRFYDNANKCFQCGQNALTCDEYHAITCKNDQYYVVRGSDNYYHDCAFIGCPSGQYVTGWDESCISCPTENADRCMPISGDLISCKEGFASDRQDGKDLCVPIDSCSTGAARDSQGDGYRCSNSCPNGATRCDMSGNALQCASGYTLQPDSTGENDGLMRCVADSVCPAHSVCDESNAVVSCSDSYLLYNGQCVESCPAGVFYYAQKAACFDECPARSWHYDMSTCYGTCPQHWIDNQYTCTECGLNAESCDQNRAITCTSDQWTVYPDNNGEYHNCAYIGCGEGQYAPDWNDQCRTCPMGPNVQYCMPITGQTTQCNEGYAMLFVNVPLGECVPVDHCEVGYRATPTPANGMQCTECPYNENGQTFRCDEDGNATECNTNFHVEPDTTGATGGLSTCVADPLV
ncbi:hypothetical protein JCM6882_006632 [Rhodosporidiobolus microsporus]